MYLKSYDDDDDTDCNFILSFYFCINNLLNIKCEGVCYNNQPKDFLTLVRNTIMAKFCRNANLHCR